MPVKANSSTQPAGGYGQADGQRRRKGSHTDSEKKTPPVSFEVYHSEAVTFQSIGEYRKAVSSYTKALELKPKDKNCFILRAQCHLLLGETEKALADANETLKDDNNFVKGVLMKAESYYQMMQFEYALVFFHRGNKLRPEVQAFRLGIQKSREAIDNCIGENAGIRLQSKGDLSFFYEEQQLKPKSGVSHSRAVIKTEEKVEERHNNKSSCRDSKTCKQLLGELYADKEFLEKLLQETESASNQSDTNKAIRSLAIRGLDYLDTRTEFWQQQKPMYSRKRDKNLREITCEPSGLDKSKNNQPRWVLKNLEEIDEAQAEGRYEASLKQAKKVLKDVERWSDDTVCNRPELIANLNSYIGNAYLEMGQYPEALHHHNTDYDIGKKNRLSDAESRALDNLGRVHARMGKFNKAVEVWKKRLPMSKSPLERTWLYHEIGRCYLEMGDFDEAREYGEKSLSAAEEVKDDVWQLNSRVLIAHSQAKLGELYSALESFENAQDLAKRQKDDPAELAIQKAIDDINATLSGKEGNDESGRQSSRQSSRRSELSSRDEQDAEDEPNDQSSSSGSSKESDDERERDEMKDNDSSGDETKSYDTDDDTPQAKKQRDSTTSESEREQSDDEDSEKEEKTKKNGTPRYGGNSNKGHGGYDKMTKSQKSGYQSTKQKEARNSTVSNSSSKNLLKQDGKKQGTDIRNKNRDDNNRRRTVTQEETKNVVRKDQNQKSKANGQQKTQQKSTKNFSNQQKTHA